MSARENFVSIEGNLVAAPELRFTPTGKAVTTLTIAQSDRRLVDGQWVDGKTSYFDCVAWDRLAEHSAQTLEKGARVTVSGRLDQRSWDDPTSGDKRYKIEVVCDSVNVSLRFATAAVSKASFGGMDAEDVQRVETSTAVVASNGRTFEAAIEEEPF